MRAHRWVWVASCFVGLCAVAASACVGEDPQAQGTTDAGGGTDATNTADQSAPIDGQAPADATADAAAGFCASRTSALFCEDFDRGALAGFGWLDRTVAPSANLVVGNSERSAPNALNSRCAESFGGDASAKASLEHALALPTTYKKLRISADLRFLKRATPLNPIHEFELKSGDLTIGMLDNGDPGPGTAQLGVVCRQVDGGFGLIVPLGPYPEAWGRFTYELAPGGAGETTVSVSRDGVLIGGGTCVGPTATTATLEIGAWSNAQNGEAIHEVDNVLVESEL
jgi:hypothetical protein